MVEEQSPSPLSPAVSKAFLAMQVEKWRLELEVIVQLQTAETLSLQALWQMVMVVAEMRRSELKEIVEMAVAEIPATETATTAPSEEVA